MRCADCGHETTFTECYATSVEKHGLDGPPYEHFTDTWLECDNCGARLEPGEPIRIMLEACLDRAGLLTNWERKFIGALSSLSAHFGAGSLTPLQRQKLKQIYTEKICAVGAKR